MLQSKSKHIIVIGGGFAGLNFIKALSNEIAYFITLVDKNNYNQFTPLVYQVATGFLEPSNITYPFRKFLRGRKNVRFHLGELLKIDAAEHVVYLNNAALPYDYLVLASGSTSNFFGNHALKAKSIAMKTLTDALNMRNILLQTLEEACNTPDELERKKLLTTVVAGGGPTGVEVSGMLGEMKKYIIRKDYPELENSMGDIYLVDGAKTLLSQMSKQAQDEATKTLKRLGVKIVTGTLIKAYDHDEVVLSNGDTIPTKNLIWAAGVTGHIIDGIPTSAYSPGKRIMVDQFNRVTGIDDVYAIGDNCLLTWDNKFPNGHPQLAQPAIQQGKHLAKNFLAVAKGYPMKPFTYNDKGVMAIIGKKRAVVDLEKPKMHIKGFFALLIWLFIHIASLIAFDNKLKTLFNWIITYFTGDQSLRTVIKTRDKSSI